jgi:hypothetical protein
VAVTNTRLEIAMSEVVRTAGDRLVTILKERLALATA